MGATWGSAFGSGLWNAFDREAHDFQAKRKKRLEEEALKRRQIDEAMAQAKAQEANLFPALDSAAGMPVSGIFRKGADSAGIPTPQMSYSGVMEQEQAKRDAEENILKDYEQAKRDYNTDIWNTNRIINAYKAKEAQDKLDYFEANKEKAERNEALKARQDSELYKLKKLAMQKNIEETSSRIRENNEHARYWSNGGRGAGQNKSFDDTDSYNTVRKDLLKRIRESESRMRQYSEQKRQAEGAGREVKSGRLDADYANEQKAWQQLQAALAKLDADWADSSSGASNGSYEALKNPQKTGYQPKAKGDYSKVPNNPVDRINKAVDIFSSKISAAGTERLNAAGAALNAKMSKKQVITAKEYYDYIALKGHNPKLAAKLKEYIMEDPRIRADYDPNKFTK